MWRLKSVLLFNLAFFMFVGTSYSQISKAQAKDIVMNDVVAQDTLNINVYLFPNTSSEGNFNLSPYDSIVNPYDTAWLFFIDLMPDYGWAHPCKYVFIRKSTGNYTVVEGSMPPLFYWLNWEEASVPFPHQNFIQSTDTTFQASCNIFSDPHKYALLITWWAKEDQARWNNLSHVYSGLTQTYGFLDNNIFVLSGDGNFDPDSMNLDLNGDNFDNDFDGPCTKEKIGEIFEYLDSVMTDEDIFLFYATTHGDTLIGDPLDTTSLRLWEDEKFYDYELEEMVDNLDCSQMVFCIDACYAGGFLEELEGEHRIFQMPVPRGKFTSRMWNDFDYFTYGWATAVRGWHVKDVTKPWEQSVYRAGYHPHLDSINSDWKNKVDFDPDSLCHGGNQDGFLQFGEVFNYLKNFDGQAQQYNLDYQNHGFRGDLFTLNGIEGRVDTSQNISGNFLIGRKLTISPGVVLSDNSSYQDHCNIFLNNSTEILVKDSATMNINGPFTKFTGSSGQSNINIEGEISDNYMNFQANPGDTLNVNFNSPQKKYALGYFNFENASIHAECDSLSFSYSNFDDSPIEFTGSQLVLNNSNEFSDSPLNISGNYLTITNYNHFNACPLNITYGTTVINEANYFTDSDINCSGVEFFVTGPNHFTGSSLDLSNGNFVIKDDNVFTNSTISIEHPVDEAASVDITNNSFDNDTTTTENYIITLEDYKNFQIDSNNLSYASGRGIELFNAGWDGRGLQQIAANTIELKEPSTSLWNDVGVHSYYSKVDIINNQIRKNSYGLVGFHNSDIKVLGDSTANEVSETQLIGDNTRVQCLFNIASFPTEFCWNVIRDTAQYSFQYHPFIKTVEFDELMQDTTGGSNWRGAAEFDVINNCWVNDTTPADRLLPIGAYFWRDPWCPPGGGHLKSESIPQVLYYQAEANIEIGNYTVAESAFKQVIAEYPANEYAMSSLKGLYALNPALYNSDYSELKSYLDSLAPNPGDSLLGKTAEWFSIRCNIENQNYQQAVNSLDSILANPGSYADSVFALIDLGEVFAEMSDTSGLKLSVITNNPHVIPGSYKQFIAQRKDWIDLLLISDEDMNKEEIQAENNKDLQKLAELKSIFPNPAKESFTIDYIANKSGTLSISLISSQGVEIVNFAKNVNEGYDYYETINTFSLPEGIYIIALSFEHAIQDAGKIVIRK